jgi:hypothetical protein
MDAEPAEDLTRYVDLPAIESLEEAYTKTLTVPGTATGGIDDADQASAKKARRAALMMAFVDAGVDMPGNGAMTPEELTFMDDGPLKPADFLAEAETIAAKRLIAL